MVPLQNTDTLVTVFSCSIRLYSFIVRFPLSNEINTTQTDSSVKAAVKDASDYNGVDVCMSSAVQYASKVQSHIY